MVLLIQSSYFQLAGFIIDFTVLSLILAVGIKLLIQINDSFSESQREYQKGISLFLISIAFSMLIYGIDLISRIYFGHRIFPAAENYEAAGIFFDSFHPQSYFILIMTFLLLATHFLVKPIEKYMLKWDKMILSKMSLILLPLPLIIRFLELAVLPHKGEFSYNIFTSLYILIWLVIAASIGIMLFLYLRVALKSSKEFRYRAIAVDFSIILWLATVLQRPVILKELDVFPYMFWIPGAIEFLMLLGFTYGFKHNMGESKLFDSEKTGNYLYNSWTFKTMLIALFISITTYFSIIAWNEDLTLAIYWKSISSSNTSIDHFGEFFDRSFFSGEPFGGQDITYILVIPFILMYLAALFVPKIRERLDEKGLLRISGYVVVMVVSLALVNRAFKGFFARARPGATISDPSLYSRIWEIGTLSLDDALSSGSFTSGHTTTAMIVVGLAFLLIKTHKTWMNLLGFLLAYFYAALMAFGRMAHGAHYLGDVIWAIAISTIVIWHLFFNVFKMHKQFEGRLKINDQLYEFKWMILSIFYIIFVFLFASGIKFCIIDFSLQWLAAAILSPIAIVFIHVLMKKMEKSAFEWV